MIVGTPRPSSPTSRAQAPRNSTSLDALERLPSLSLSRWRWKRLRSPSGVKRGIRKQESPPAVCARTRNASHIGAEQNHLWPVISYSAARAAAVQRAATVVLARTSEPPCFSVIAIPQRAPGLSARRHAARGRSERGEPRLPLRGELGLARAAPAPPSRSSRSGSRRPASAWPEAMNSAARATWAPGRGSRHGSACRPCSTPSRHQLVPGGVELDLVDAVAEAVVGAQPRRVLVRLGRPSGSPAASRRTRRPREPAPRPSRRPRGAAPRPGRGRCRRRCSPRAARTG